MLISTLIDTQVDLGACGPSQGMTRKDFVAAAEIVRLGTPEQHKAAVAAAFADLFRSDNPRFDRGRFEAACGLGSPAKPGR